MSNLIYSLNATVPVFLVIVVGYVLKKIGWITPEFIKVANKINFKVTLPCLLIQDLMNTVLDRNLMANTFDIAW